MTYCAKCGAQVPAGAAFCPACGSPVAAAGATGPQTPVSGISTLTKDTAAQEYWVRRLIAFVIDAIIVYVVIGVVVAATVLPAYITSLFVPGHPVPISYVGGFLTAIAGLLLVIYFTLAEATYGKTIGKHVMNLRVAADAGGKPSMGTSLLRNLSKIYWVLLLLDVILGLALEVGYKKKLSDKYLGTSVVPA